MRPHPLASLPVLGLSILVSLAACGSGAASDAGVSSDAGAADAALDAADPPGSDYIFDLGALHHFEVEVTAADWAFLKGDPRREEFVPATLIFEGTRHEGAALRFKGGYGTLESCFDDQNVQICPKLSLKISMTKFGAGRFFGLRKLVFHSSVRDPSLLHEVVGYHVFRAMGVPAPRASHATLSVNGEHLGLFGLIEEVDKEFIQDHYASDTGNLYKAVWPQWSYADPYVEALRTNETVADVTRMLALQAVVAAATPASFPADVTTELDLPTLARYLAVDRALNNDDGPGRFYCFGVNATECTNGNYYWYDEPGSAIHLIPWDLDYTMGDVNHDLGRSANAGGSCEPIPFCDFYQIDPCELTEEIFILPPQCDPLYGLLHGATWTAYLGALQELAAGPLSRAAIVPLVEGIRDKIRAAVDADPFGPGTLAFDDANLWLDSVLENQLTAIQTLLTEEGL